MPYYFLKEDLEELENKIVKLREQIKFYQSEKGLSVTQSSETQHDNSGFEESTRQIRRVWAEMENLARIKSNSEIINPRRNKIGLGKIFKIKDLLSGEEKEILIGSYMVFADKKAVSYDSSLAKILLGGKSGQVKSGLINGKEASFQIINVSKRELI